MTGAVARPGHETGEERRWDVALSFSGAQREYVEQVAAAPARVSGRGSFIETVSTSLM